MSRGARERKSATSPSLLPLPLFMQAHRPRRRRPECRVRILTRYAGLHQPTKSSATIYQVRRKGDMPSPRTLPTRLRAPLPGFPGLRIACRAHARHDGEGDGLRRRATRRVGGEHGGGREGVGAGIISTHLWRRASCCTRRGRDRQPTLTSCSTLSRATRRRWCERRRAQQRAA